MKILLSISGIILCILFRSCSDFAEVEFFAIGPNNTPVIHVSQEKADYCTEANILMKLMYHGVFPLPSQSDIHSSADFNLDQRLTLNEARDYLEYYHGIVLNRYYYIPSDSASQDAVADTLALGLSQCHIQGAAPIMVFYGDHTVTVAGHCYSGDETTALLVVDPATPDTARDKYIRVAKDTWAEYVLFQETGYLMISEPVYGTIFDEYRINSNIFTTNQHVETSLDSDLQNTIQLPEVREYTVSVADEDIFIDDTTQMIWAKADTALLRFFAYSLLVNPYVQERYGQLFNNTYYGTPIHTSDDDPWNPDNHLFNRYPALYMTVVPIYSNLNSDLVGSICLKYGNWDSTLSVLAVPQKPDYPGKTTKSFITPDELELYCGTKPAPFVSDRTKGVTGSFPLIDLPNYAIYDSISDTIIVFSPYGDILEVNDQGNVNLVDKNAIDLDFFKVDQADPASIVVNAINYPNPFNPSTEISFTVNNTCQVRIDIYDLLGRKVHRLIDRRLEAGAHKFKWDASSQASGVYFYRLFANDKAQITRKMVLVK